MLFNSYIFIFMFLPITLLGFFMIGKKGHHRIAIAWLVGASLFFYAWWNPYYLGLMLFSIIFNYAVGIALGQRENKVTKRSVSVLAVGVFANLALLGYFKYANFFVDNLNLVAGINFNLQTIILPLAISFFTFQQIAYLVDAFKGETKEYNFLHYCLFVTFFPQLIAGPIVHHKEMLPQFTQNWIYKVQYKHLAIGITIFTIGLFKKVILADNAAVYATPVFNAADAGVVITFVDAWIGSLAYTFQLYFDFSGYSDMAIGLARMFGIKLALNFNSPYKATNIIEFWRCWHMTLSRFLRDYLYIPLGGNRKGKVRRYINLMITMVLGGIWHGAGWTFIVWGTLHGIYLVINHAWHAMRIRLGYDITKSSMYGCWMARLVTFLSIVVAWVFFRAESLNGALNILMGMSGQHGAILPEPLEYSLNLFGHLGEMLATAGVEFGRLSLLPSVKWATFYIVLFVIIAWFAPNTQQIMINYDPAFETYKNEIKRFYNGWFEWSPSYFSALVIGLFFLYAISHLFKASEFLYFNF